MANGRVTPAIGLREVSVVFTRGLLGRRPDSRAVEQVSLTVQRGEKLGLVGASGSGKSTLGRVITGLLRPTAGKVEVAGVDPTRLGSNDNLAFRRQVQIVFQDSHASLDPRMTIEASIREGLDIHRIRTPTERMHLVREMLARVGLDGTLGGTYPHQLSGGQRQRVNIARALILGPQILVADEPVSALDVSVQAQILDLLEDLHAEFGLTMVFISHDLAVVREICDRVVVMHDGRITQDGAVDTILRDFQRLSA